jgi:hypothetical protein
MQNVLRLATVAPLLFASALASGCYMAATDTVEESASGVSANTGSDSTGSSTGVIPEGHGILESSGFKLYWEHYDAWEQGACTRMRLKNEGGEVRGWEMHVELSEDLIQVFDYGGAYFWLGNSDDELSIEQSDYSDFDNWESVEMYYCAEPAVDIDAFTITWNEGEARPTDSTPDDDSVDDGDADAEVEGSKVVTTASGHEVEWSFTSYATGTYACTDFAIQNDSDTALDILNVQVQMSGTASFVEPEGGEVIPTVSDTMNFTFNPVESTDPGDSVEGRVCTTPATVPIGTPVVRVEESI